ncbi:9221_t:CDS:2 [Ambispora gerdemannii]|uniref:9221_t:CDS:1 n=1 Tax=Ambispora gerdemannii TaxID=144530 RepID=A0A9N9AKE2_9GLOM|nr:9221_t:CDS:2 [Ambispora gerdemannii]
MPKGGLPEEILKKVQNRDYWEQPHTKWGDTNTWDLFFIKKNPEATRQISHNNLGAELEILTRNLKTGTRAAKKALAIQRDLKVSRLMSVLRPVLLVWGRRALSPMSCTPRLLVELRPVLAEKNGKRLEDLPSYDEQSHNIEDEDESNSQTYSTVEELTFDPHIATLLLPYRRVLEEMRNHHIEPESQRARHLSHMLKWSVIDHSLFNKFEFDIVSLPRPAVNMSLLESILMENQNKRFHHVVTILHSLITKEIVDNVNFSFRRWTARLWGVRMKEHYIIDTVTALAAITSVISYTSIPCRGPGSKPSENHIKAQMWAKIFSDTFLANSDDTDVNWEYHHQIPGNGGSGSARSDFAAIIFNCIDQQFPFFIVESETDGFATHKDEIVVAAEAAFEYNRILATAYYLSEDEVNATRLHIGLINGTTIHLGLMKPIYDEEKKSLIYSYEANKFTFKLHTGNQEDDIASALKLVAYLRANVCQDGIALKALLNRKTNIRNGTLLAALPCLPKRAVKSRPKSDTEFTPQTKRVRYTDVCLNNDVH